MTSELRADAVARGEIYGKQAAAQMADDVLKGRAAEWIPWQAGDYYGWHPDGDEETDYKSIVEAAAEDIYNTAAVAAEPRSIEAYGDTKNQKVRERKINGDYGWHGQGV